MRKLVYQCDQCQKDLGEKAHISLSFSDYSGIAWKPPQKYWEIRQSLKGKFMHFCTPTCIKAFFANLMKVQTPKK